MIYIGKHMMSQVLCGECGKPIGNSLEGIKSAFIAGSCRNPECESCGISMVIERSSMQIISVQDYWIMADRKRAYPVLADKDGKQVWPEEKPKMIFSGWRTPGLRIDYHPFVDRNSPADNTCAKCGYLKEEPMHTEK